MQALNGTYAPSILTVRMHRDRPGHENRSRPWYRLLSVLEGGYQLTVNGTSHRAVDGDVCLIPPAVDFHADSHDRARSQAIAFTVMACPLVRLHGHARKMAVDTDQPAPEAIWGCSLPVVQPAPVSEQVRDLIALIVAECWHDEGLRLMSQGRLTWVLERIVRPHLLPEVDQSRNDPVSRVHNVIHKRLAALHGTADIADHLGISVSQLNKIYRAASRGDTPAAYLRRYRLAETARLLLENNVPLRHIAEQVGYRDDKALYKAWVQAYDLPPRQWRMVQRQG